MEIRVLGVGEAFDAAEPNSAIVVTADGFRLLVDCGHSVPPLLWRHLPEPDAVDAVYLTHHHPDHCFGLVPVLMRWQDEGRTKPLTIVTTSDGRAQLDLLWAAGGLDPARGLPFALRWQDSAGTTRIGPFATGFAWTQHSRPNRAIRLEAGGCRLCYSGDGRPTPAAEELYRGCDLLFHECYVRDPDPELAFHCDLATVAALAERTGAGAVRLYHVRAGQRAAVAAALADHPRLSLAKAGEVVRLL